MLSLLSGSLLILLITNIMCTKILFLFFSVVRCSTIPNSILLVHLFVLPIFLLVLCMVIIYVPFLTLSCLMYSYHQCVVGIFIFVLICFFLLPEITFILSFIGFRAPLCIHQLFPFFLASLFISTYFLFH